MTPNSHHAGWKSVVLRYETLLLAVLVVEWLLFYHYGTTTNRRGLVVGFGTIDRQFDILRHSCEIGLLALALTPVILTAGIDLSVMGTDPPDGPFRQRQLGQERFVLLARHGHPALDRGLTAEAFAALPQALVSPRGTGMVGPVDTALAALGLRRQVRLSVTRFTTLPTILAATDLIAAVPASFADRPEVRAVCGQRSLPFASPVLTWRLVWHVVHDADPGNRWLRGLA